MGMITKEYFGEGKHIEFKQQLPKNREHILKDIIAFSNTSGGKLILGIGDETGVVVGIGDQSPFKLSDAISTMISDACTPQIEPDIAATTIEDKTVLIIDVPAGKFRPYYLKSKGKEKSTYIRINGTSRPADDNKIKELELEGENRYYDSMTYIGRDYSQEKAEALCKEMYDKAVHGCSSPEEQRNIHPMTVDKLIDFEIIRQSGNMLYPTNAFDLLTDNSHRMAKIQCAVF